METTLASKLSKVGVDILDLYKYNTKTSASIGYHLYQQHDIDIEEWIDLYHGAINTCILHSNYKTMNHMWDATYFCDRDCPDFESNLRLALEHADVPTVLVCLYGYTNYYVYNWYEKYITFQEMYNWTFMHNTTAAFKPILDMLAELKKVCDDHLFISSIEGDSDADDFDEKSEIHNKKRNKWLKMKLLENDVDLHELDEEFKTCVKAIRAKQ
jgi:hypothetical protein